MSSLWTPYGEVAPEPERAGEGPADGERSASGTPGSPAAPGPVGAGGPERELTEEEMAQMQAQLLATPVAGIVANNALQFYELAVLHLSYARAAMDAVASGEPTAGDGQGAAAHAHHTEEASLAIDGLSALLDAAGERLGEAGTQLREVLVRIRLFYVEVAGSAS